MRVRIIEWAPVPITVGYLYSIGYKVWQCVEDSMYMHVYVCACVDSGPCMGVCTYVMCFKTLM